MFTEYLNIVHLLICRLTRPTMLFRIKHLSQHKWHNVSIMISNTVADIINANNAHQGSNDILDPTVNTCLFMCFFNHWVVKQTHMQFKWKKLSNTSCSLFSDNVTDSTLTFQELSGQMRYSTWLNTVQLPRACMEGLQSELWLLTAEYISWCSDCLYSRTHLEFINHQVFTNT